MVSGGVINAGGQEVQVRNGSTCENGVHTAISATTPVGYAELGHSHRRSDRIVVLALAMPGRQGVMPMDCDSWIGDQTKTWADFQGWGRAFAAPCRACIIVVTIAFSSTA